MKVTVFDNGKTFYLVLGDELYEVGARANMPNGLCLYLGKVADFTLPDLPEIPETDWPTGLSDQICQLRTKI